MNRNTRWSDNDKYWGPFTYARSTDSYKPLAIILSSGDGDDSPNSSIRFSGFGHTLITYIPNIIKPYKSKYYIHKREYGFSSNEGFFQLFYGPQTHDSENTKSYSKFLPWMNWRHVRWSAYDRNGDHFATAPQGKGMQGYEEWSKARDECPKRRFLFSDYDGEEIIATTYITEGEWRFGESWFKWLSIFRRKKIIRSLDLLFSEETGKRKESWKGGTIETSINMLPNEMHEAAFRRYCEKNNMTFKKELDK